MGTGLIFAAVIAIWVAYGVPLALRRHEEASRAGGVTSFSGALRVLTHRKDDAEAEPVTAEVAPSAESTPSAEAAKDASDESADSADDASAAPAPVPHRYNRRAARIAARRRRRVLLVLLAACAIVGGLAVAGILLPWAPAIPAGIVVAWLVLCRVMVRREIGRPVRMPRAFSSEGRATRSRKREIRKTERRAARDAQDEADLQVDPDSELTVVLSGQFEDHDPGRRNVMERGPLPEGALDQQVLGAVPLSTTSGTTLWDPVPVTLPTYVTKPAAARTVRTIDFGDGPAAERAQDEGSEGDAGTSRRAVGD
ncbi:hypothetical protein FE697_011760 [Mumia zhuanghuii]|uniref:Uncharacterized protein n=2 Tax=Mumia TaxID=1546255 RepID=A0ABW1QG21_9ACTN|nr:MULTISPECIES: hypothetical protein [Mumia]KAA1422823.1 hypothetical protein FE697_011760 [Mumia zhuanghuii]